MYRITTLLLLIFTQQAFSSDSIIQKRSSSSSLYVLEEEFDHKLHLYFSQKNIAGLDTLLSEFVDCSDELCLRKKNLLKSFLHINLKQSLEQYEHIRQVLQKLNWQMLSDRDLRNLFETYISSQFIDVLFKSAEVGPKFEPDLIFDESIQDIFYTQIDKSKYMKGRFVNTPTLYMFCRQSRKYPCRLVMRDKNGDAIYDSETGELWSMPVLAYSRKKKDYDEFDGNTPAGIYRIEGVMPQANRRLVFGKYRRLILDFIHQAPDEKWIKSLLPDSSWQQNWWTESVIARDMGRSLFRIHGTGMGNANSRSTYYPFVATRGCVASREGRYDRFYFTDQKLLLDQILLASGMSTDFDNQTKIKALLYLVEIDNKTSAVSLNDLSAYNIQ